jgi:tetratricopeptide (TPR) repeat protein
VSVTAGRRSRGYRLQALLSRTALPAAVGAGIFALAFQSGGYAVTVRNPVAIALWWTIVLAVALSVWPLARPPHAALFSGAALTGLMIFTAVAISWSDSAERAVGEMNRVALYLGVFVLVVVAAQRGSARRWADGLALGIAAVGLLALASRLFPDAIGDRGVSSFFPGGVRYLGYPLDYWNGLGIFLGLGMPVVLRMGVAERSLRARALAVASLPALVAVIYLTSSRGGFATAALAILVFVLLTAGRARALGALAVTSVGSVAAIAVLEARDELADGRLSSPAVIGQGRSAAGLLVAICLITGFAYALACRVSIPTPRLRLPRAAVAALAIVLVLGVAVAGDPTERFEDFKQPPRNPFATTAAASTSSGATTSESTSSRSNLASTSSHLLNSGGNGRWQFWQAAVDEFESAPVVGRGPGSYEAWWAQHGRISYFTRFAHSLYLQTLGELGLAGLLLLLAALAPAVPAVRGRMRAARGDDRSALAALAAVVAAFAFGAAIDWIWELTIVGAVGIAALALVVGPATLFGSGSEKRSLSRRGRIIARGAVAVIGLAIVVAQSIPFLTQDKLELSQRRFAAGDLAGALDAARDARGIQPWASSPHLQIALVEEASGHLRAARRAIRQAIQRDPSDWRLWLTAARIDQNSGQRLAARRNLSRAVELNPRSPLLGPYRNLARGG